METLLVQGGARLTGRVAISGAKNAALPVIAAALLTGETVNLSGVPGLDDINTMCELLESVGVGVHWGPGCLSLNAQDAVAGEVSYNLVKRMRASFLIAGPMLARFGYTRMPMPGGCAIGSRPIDLHLKAFSAMGAELSVESGYIEARAPNGLKSAHIYFDYPSVGATENAMMAAALVRGDTVLENVAREPEIVDLANLLTKMGAKVVGAGTGVIRIRGAGELQGTSHTVIPDRIEAGTYMTAAAITKGDVILENVVPEHLTAVIAKLREIGAHVDVEESEIHVFSDKEPTAVDIKTMPYPGFPTDLQAQFMALLSLANGMSIVTETVFENRFMHVYELARMGAKIKIDGRAAIIEGVGGLSGAPVAATDLRAGAALVIAGLVANGTTEVVNIAHIDRGYEDLEKKLCALGASITRKSPSEKEKASAATAS
ncbi:MAG: UDP-N-acetylglucosamine 1-carboxyvinyltransferase [Bacillota bacterium]|nr:UDP-N-acetylglucosamine 1-carboxyvinyltransferase [Bacillota bacterium]MDI9415634.1 UDP-N-acetylglucosamine 1-carboxyvinyltransferase [Bacillota bacterium]NLD12283.1 UDP-N-acetylglucosamine 1-carboxyvinyltransferase [Bacillota bacterium]HAV21773.1 UDP-N-acetylglucosamine 1-carboxyvinyltransferase [Bacillota bacterium]HCD41165.1 UDP-N-acetylglucosamine 1-carboxyvinyltransferase [Bacillota bacterium]